MPVAIQTQLPSTPRSIDRIRLIRRSMRCFTFGVIGLVPVLGTGLAIQALRLGRAISSDLDERWQIPPVPLYWLIGMVALWATDAAFGLAGDLFAMLVAVGAQSWHVWRRLVAQPEKVWNPARSQVIWGVTLAYAGLAFSLWTLAILAYKLAKMNAPV